MGEKFNLKFTICEKSCLTFKYNITCLILFYIIRVLNTFQPIVYTEHGMGQQMPLSGFSDLNNYIFFV